MTLTSSRWLTINRPSSSAARTNDPHVGADSRPYDSNDNRDLWQVPFFSTHDDDKPLQALGRFYRSCFNYRTEILGWLRSDGRCKVCLMEQAFVSDATLHEIRDIRWCTRCLNKYFISKSLAPVKLDEESNALQEEVR